MKLSDIRTFANPNDAIDSKRLEIGSILDEIKRKAANYYYATGVGAGVNWSHAETMAHLAAQLQEISNSLGVDGDDNVVYRK